RVQVFDADGHFLTHFGGPEDGKGALTYPSGLALDGQGNVYVGEGMSNRIVKYRLLPPFVPAAAATATPAATPAAPSAAPPVQFLWRATGGVLSYPCKLTVDPGGRLWATDTANSRFAIFGADGAFLETWGAKGQTSP